MTDLEKKVRAKIPGKDTGVEVVQSICDMCAPGPHCGLDCYVRDGRIIKIEGTKEHPTNRGVVCTRGLANREYIYRKDRIMTPLRRIGPRGEGRYEPISWDEAYDTIAEKMLGYKREFGAESVVFYSGYNKWYRPFLERLTYAFGSPNYGTESSCCFTASIMAWRLAVGASKCEPDMRNCKLLVGWAYGGYYNAYLSADRILSLHEKGMKVIIIDQRLTPMAERVSDLFIRVRPGTDAALAFCFANLLIQNGAIDREYIDKHVHGFEEYAEYVKQFTPEYASQLCGAPVEDILKAAEMIMNEDNRPVAINESGAALLHHRNGMQGYRAVMALSALMGTFDRPGGQIPTPMSYAHSMSGFETDEIKFSVELRPKDALPVGAEKYPLWYETIHEMQSMDLPRQIMEETPYPIKMIWAHGMNFRMWNNSDETRRALEEVEFFVDIDLFLTDTAKYADIVLPACSGFEREEFRVFGGGFATYTNQVIEPLGESKPDTTIIFELARRLELEDELIVSDYDTCLRYMVKNISSMDIELLKKEPFPIHIDAKYYEAGTWKFTTPTGKFELWSSIIEKYQNMGFSPLPIWEAPLSGDAEEYPYVMTSGIRLPHTLHSRLHDVPWLRTLRPYPTADISLEDAQELGVAEGDDIEIYTDQASITVKANPTIMIMKGVVSMYHGYREADTNSLMHTDDRDRYSGFPCYKSYRCGVRKKERG